MKKARNVVLALLCALLLIVGSVAGTLAYLTSTSGTVTNTFTAGSVKITLDETKVDVYGVAESGVDPVTTNVYKLIPGHTYTKDPTIHVTKGSEQCYLFVKVTNGISGIEGGTTIAQQMEANGWKLIADSSDTYYYAGKSGSDGIVDARTVAVNIPVFGTFTIASDADVSTHANSKIEIIAYAVQADTFADAAAAWAAAPASWTNS